MEIIDIVNKKLQDMGVSNISDTSQLLGYRITEHAEMYGSVICSTRKGMLTRLSATELTAFML